MNTSCVASSVRCLAAAAMFAVTAVCQAAPVSWLIQGTLTQATGASLPSFINAGDSFSVVLHFDTSTPVSNPVACGDGGIGTICRHNGGLGQYFSNLVIDGQLLGDFYPSPANNNLIFVRNNMPPPEDPGSPVRVDGYSFLSNTDLAFMDVIFRGPEHLDLVTDGRLLPASPPAGLTDLSIRVFEYCAANSIDSVDCDRFVAGHITSVVAVPEPGSLALLGLGLAGLAAKRRRKRKP